MNCAPSLTAHEFKDLHNALCDLRNIRSDMEHSMVKVDRVEDVIARFEQALSGAYQQDDDAFETKSDHYDEVKKALGLDAVWSIFDVDHLEERHRFGDINTVTYETHWGSKPVVKGIVGGTWAALYTAANACIRDSGDEHHIFIERFDVKGNTLILTTGS